MMMGRWGWRAWLMACSLAMLPGCGGGGGAEDGARTGAPTINVFPSSTAIEPGGSVQFRTTLENWTGGVVWEVDEDHGGSVTAGGLYTAPAALGAYTVIARSVIDGGVTGHAVVVVGGRIGAIDTAFSFTASPVQPGVMLVTSDTGCIRGQLIDRRMALVRGVTVHLYRLTEAAGRAWERGEPVDLDPPAPASRQAGRNTLEEHRATTTSTGYGFYMEPSSNYTFGTTPPGYYAITTEADLPDGRRVEVLGAIGRVFLGADTVLNVFADQSPTVASTELLPGQTRQLAQNADTFSYFIGKFDSSARELTEVAGAGTFVGGTYTAGNTLGVYTAAVVRDSGPIPATGLAAVHVVGVRTQFPSAELQFDGGDVVLAVAAVDGLTGSTPRPVPLQAVVTGPDGFSQAVPLTVVTLAATSFGAADFTYPDDWQFFTGTVTLPANLTNAPRTYSAAVTATYGVAGAVTQAASTDVRGLNQPADPPVIRTR